VQERTKETWVLTDEAKGYAAKGSPEAQLVAAIPPEGASKGALKVPCLRAF
jgi:phenylalanyl-tRNA synthetase alpha chain